MTADPVTEPVTQMTQDPADLLIVIEEASEVPIRPECVEGMVLVPPQPDNNHNHGAGELYFQLRLSGITLAGLGNGYRSATRAGATHTLCVPDFYVLRREPTELDEAYRKAHKGWYPLDMVALVGEVTSSNHETDTGPKFRSYAAAGVPVYVLVDRNEGMAYAYSDPYSDPDDPTKSRYRTDARTELGGKLTLPAPYPVLDTAPLLGD